MILNTQSNSRVVHVYHTKVLQYSTSRNIDEVKYKVSPSLSLPTVLISGIRSRNGGEIITL